jgi:hypothetical protein
MSVFSRMVQAKHLPILLLIIANLLAGLFTFRDYGLSWDEPLFYGYADALGYAYTPANWFDPSFDLSQAYGPSGDDHKTRGPAYLLLARTPVHLLESLGVDEASAWHLVNFLTFLLGVYFIYRLGLRWMSNWAAFGAALLFSTQPLLWGHAFINPKDIPFMVFFLGALVFGFEMVDRTSKSPQKKSHLSSFIFHPSSFILASFFLGIATSIRILAPLAGILVVIYAITRLRSTVHSPRSIIFYLLAYTLLTIFTMFISWPYLWEAPLTRFIDVFRFMSENPTGLQVLFDGEIYRAYELPRRYLPTLLTITLTEPVWPLFFLGLGFTLWRTLNSFRSKNASTSTPNTTRHPPSTVYHLLSTDYWLTLTAFIIPFIYVILRKPPIYDGFRHFLFILPPVFLTCGLGMDAIFGWLEKYSVKIHSKRWLCAVVVFALFIPGLLGIVQLHPYEYTYYNSLVGGTGGAFRTYETDYWLTCYKEAVEQFNTFAPRPANLFIHREATIAAGYAAGGITVSAARGNLSAIQSGDYLLVNTRTNEDRKTFRDAPVIIEIGRGGATFCVVKQVP